MTNKNICKFVPASAKGTLEVESFIYESDYRTMRSPKVLSRHHAILVISGSGTFRWDTVSVNGAAGDLFFAFAGESFCVVSGEDFSYMYITFSGSRAEELFHRFGIHKGNRLFKSFDGLLPLWQESLSRADQANVDLAAESMLLYTFSRLTHNASKNEVLVERIISLSEEHFHDASLSLTLIAEELNYNPKYLSHLFKEKTGISYTEYLRSLRIKYAVTLLDHGLDAIKNVALLSGFSDQFYFSTVFKNTVGMSPKAYILRQKSKSDDLQ